MDRRALLQAIGVSAAALATGAGATNLRRQPLRRARPGDAEWPSAEAWGTLKADVGGNLIVPKPLFANCAANTACDDMLKNIRNPYFLGDDPAGTQVSGWLDGWSSAPSAYAIAARDTADVVAGVRFAREHNLRLVVKGGGHSYQGTSNAPDSLLIWTRAMTGIALHDAFVAKGCEDHDAPQPAVAVGAGCVWMDVYDAVTTRAGRYVQGGGCATVGVAGLIQSGGFGSFSKNYGIAAAGLLEAEVVTADGTVRVANARTNSDLFWALQGGGGGTFGVVTRLTLKTHPLPGTFGDIAVTIQARSDAAFRKLIGIFLDFYRAQLFNPHWGENAAFQYGNTLSLSMVFQGLHEADARARWQAFLEPIAADDDFTITSPFAFEIMEARRWWDVDYLQKYSIGSVTMDDRPGAKPRAWWTGDGRQAGEYLYGYHSTWMPAALLNSTPVLADAIFAATRHWTVSLHLNKGMAGAPPGAVAEGRRIAANPAVCDAFALAIISGGTAPHYPGMPGAALDGAKAHDFKLEMDTATKALRTVVPNAGSYVSESDYFEIGWQHAHWGANYQRLLAIKRKYDPEDLFIVHHGVGSENWSADGFTRGPA